MEGLRERKKRQTYRTIEEEAIRLFTERGFDEVSVEDVALEVGISSRTVFRYFGNKENLVLAPMQEVERVLDAALTGRPPDEPVLDVLRHAMEDVAVYLSDLEPDLSRRSAITWKTPALMARALQLPDAWRRRMVTEAARRLGLDPINDMGPQAAAAWAMAGLSVARELWDHGSSRSDLMSLLAKAYEMLSGDLAAALLPVAGRRRSAPR